MGTIGRFRRSRFDGISRGRDESLQPGTRVPGKIERTILSREATAFSDGHTGSRVACSARPRYGVMRLAVELEKETSFEIIFGKY
jgi:hypothetical protein